MNLVSPGRKRPWYMTKPRSGRNPFDSLGRDYCLNCRQDVDTDTEAHHQGTTYVYKRNCCRCGDVINWGAYDQVAVLDGPTPGLIRAMEWIYDPKQDRR
jgi:hypothetical protein